MPSTSTRNRHPWPRRTGARTMAPILGGLLAASAVGMPQAHAAVPDNTVLELFAGASEPLTPSGAARAACGTRVDTRTFPTGLPAGSFAQVVIQGTLRETIPRVGDVNSQTEANRVVCWNIGGTWVLASDGYRPPRVSASSPLLLNTSVLRTVTTRNATTGSDSLSAERVVHRGNRPRNAKDDLSFILSGELGAVTADTATVGGVDFAVDADSQIDAGLASGDEVSVQYLPTALLGS